MANTKISALPDADTLTGTELTVAVQSGGDVQTTLSDVAALFGPLQDAIVTGKKIFAPDKLQVANDAETYTSQFESAATANRTLTLPDADCTVAQAAVATASTTPAFATNLTGLLQGATVSWSDNTAVISAGGAVFAAHVLAGCLISDGTGLAVIADNGATTETSGNLTCVPALTGTTVDVVAIQAPHTHTQT